MYNNRTGKRKEIAMLYETARDAHHLNLDPVEAASEYLNLFAVDGGLAAGFRVGYRRRASSSEFAEFRRFLRLIEG
jgi:hypothetical protein